MSHRVRYAQVAPAFENPEGFESDMAKHNRNFQRKGHRSNGVRRWDARKFIAWDGEGTAMDSTLRLPMPGTGDYLYFDDENGMMVPKPEYKPQPYVLLANSEGDQIKRKEGLHSRECLELILNTKKKHPMSIFVGFGFNYDINQMLKDLPKKLQQRLYEKNTCMWGGYWLEWLPRKSFTITHRTSRRSAIIYDVFGFFQTSFLETCKKYLGKNDPDLDQIQKGKEKRELFTWEELDEFIIPYNNKELSMLVRVMNQLRQDLHDVGINPVRWHGPGAIANEVLRKYNVPTSRTIPKEVLDASQYAYAGGRFEPFWLGRYAGHVYEYDIHSAYPAALATLPDISAGSWEHVKEFEPGSFGVWNVEYRSPGGYLNCDHRPQPLFCRSETGHISYPDEVQGWYWTPEASLVPDSVREGWVFRTTSEARPFAFVKEYYDQRRILQSLGSSTERAIKLILNSLYGKLAQTVGGKKGKPPRWHQLEYAGYITSYTRAMIYRAVSSNAAAIIAVETDAVFSTEPLDLPVSGDLGDWELKEYDEITYLQSGFYYAVKPDKSVVCKYRGMDRDRNTQQPVGLPYRKVLDHLRRRTGYCDRRTPSLSSHTTRFIGMGMALNRESAVWRSWEKEPKQITLDTKPWLSKRYHMSHECDRCHDGVNMYEGMHPLKIGGYAGKSFARKLPWRELGEKEESAPLSWDEWKEMNGDILVMEEIDRWS